MSKEASELIVIGAANPTIIRLIEDINQVGNEQFNIVGFLDNRFDRNGGNFYGFPVLGGFSDVSQFNKKKYVLINTIAGSSSSRRMTTEYFLLQGYSFANVVHPSVNVARVSMGVGNLIYENAMLHPFVTLGSHNVISSNSGIAHETELADYVFLGPASYVCGKCKVGTGAYIGVGAKILPRLSIGINSVVGAGAVVTQSVPDSEMHLGVPARKV